MHFLYELTNLKFIGLLVPINESVFEHLKLFSFPMIVYGVIVGYKYKENININNWFLAILVWWLVAVFGVLSSYYILSAGLEIKSLPVDIAFLFVSLLAGAVLANHIYHYSSAINYKISSSLLLLIILMIGLLTIYPPKAPMFKDNANNIYGFEKE